MVYRFEKIRFCSSFRFWSGNRKTGKIHLKSFTYKGCNSIPKNINQVLSLTGALMEKSTICKLYLIQLKNNGIPENLILEKEKELVEKKGEKYFLKKEYRKNIKVVLTGGVFDVIHVGHVYTLNEAKKHGDILVVAIANDEHITRKGRHPIHSQEHRTEMVEMLKPVDYAILGKESPEELTKKVKPDVIVYGYDQKEFLKPEGIKIIKLDKGLKEKDSKTGKIIDKLGL